MPSIKSLEPIIQLNAKTIVNILYGCTSVLVILSLVGDYLLDLHPTGNHFVNKYVDFFNLNKENNLPTLFSTVLLFVAGLLNFVIYNIACNDTSKRKNRFYWFLLGVIFIYLGLDESLQLHDMLNNASSLQKIEEENKFARYGWVIPYAVGLIIVGSLMLKFVFSLPPNTRNRFIISGFVYVGGAMGFEMIESFVFAKEGEVHNLLAIALTTIEETMEMVGVILFIHALLDYIALSRVSFKVKRRIASH